MFVNRLLVRNFRNLKNISVDFNKNINVLYGDNAQGKTSILECIYFCATGRSHKTHIDKNVICFGTEEAHLQLYVNNNSVSDKIDVHLKKNVKKGIAVNNVPLKKIGELFGILHIVLFAPEDLTLIKAGPSERRRFIDLELCQLSRVYYYALKQYCRILKQRNNLLKKIQKDKTLKNSLYAWNSQLAEFGKKIIIQRKNFVEEISESAAYIHNKITGGKEKLDIIYNPNSLAENFEKALENNADKDIFYGTTGKGPHRDDLSFIINGYNVKAYGSQGQQRTAALSSKLAEIEIIKKEKDTSPVLLLDDVLSELDEKRQSFLFENIKDIQVIITCTGVEDILRKNSRDFNLFSVKDGNVYLVE